MNRQLELRMSVCSSFLGTNQGGIEQVNEPDFRGSEDLGRAIVAPRRNNLCRKLHGLCQGKIVFQSCFMLTTVQPRFGASSRQWSSLPKGDLRS